MGVAIVPPLSPDQKEPKKTKSLPIPRYGIGRLKSPSGLFPSKSLAELLFLGRFPGYRVIALSSAFPFHRAEKWLSVG